MVMYILPIALVVVSNVVYNICQKSTPQNANPYIALLVTYLTAALLTLIIYQFNKADKGFWASLGDLNWTSLALGVTIVGLEIGFLMAYRVGWNISVGFLVANTFVAVMLIPVGILLYHEGFELSKVLGVVLCLAGLIMINRP
ncbi:MAG: EamA family transporter [Methylocystaceae bacterium]